MVLHVTWAEQYSEGRVVAPDPEWPARYEEFARALRQPRCLTIIQSAEVAP